jgi:hypothetical protein
MEGGEAERRAGRYGSKNGSQGDRIRLGGQGERVGKLKRRVGGREGGSGGKIGKQQRRVI